jgi:hypothetical protein
VQGPALDLILSKHKIHGGRGTRGSGGSEVGTV